MLSEAKHLSVHRGDRAKNESEILRFAQNDKHEMDGLG